MLLLLWAGQKATHVRSSSGATYTRCQSVYCLSRLPFCQLHFEGREGPGHHGLDGTQARVRPLGVVTPEARRRQLFHLHLGPTATGHVSTFATHR